MRIILDFWNSKILRVQIRSVSNEVHVHRILSLRIRFIGIRFRRIRWNSDTVCSRSRIYSRSNPRNPATTHVSRGDVPGIDRPAGESPCRTISGTISRPSAHNRRTKRTASRPEVRAADAPLRRAHPPSPRSNRDNRGCRDRPRASESTGRRVPRKCHVPTELCARFCTGSSSACTAESSLLRLISPRFSHPADHWSHRSSP